MKTKSFRKTAIITAAVVLMGAFAYIFLSPFITMYEIKVGLDTNDQEKLNANIDFPALKSNIKEQLNAKMVKKFGVDSNNPIGGLILSFGSNVTEGIVDGIVTPQGLSAVLEGKKYSKNESKDSLKEKKSIFDFMQQFDFRFESASRFTAQLQGRKKVSTFILERQGLSWKLVNVILPD